MASKRVVLVVAGGIVLGIAFAVFYATVLGPRSLVHAAQKEIERWSDAWEEARDCLVSEPASPDGFEALVAREIVEADPKDELTACNTLLRELGRKPGPSSENAAIEAKWMDLQKAVQALAHAHALRTAKLKQADATFIRGKLGRAISAVDDAQVALRSAADLKTPARDGERFAAAKPPVVLAGPAGEPLAVEDYDVAHNVVLATGTMPGGGVTARMSQPPPAPAEIIRLTGTAVARGGNWGIGVMSADAGPPQLCAGAIGADGYLMPPCDAIESLNRQTIVEPLFALGEAPSRVAIYETRTDPEATAALFHIARNTVNPPAWNIDVQMSSDGIHFIADHGLGRADVLWPDGGVTRWLEIRGDTAGTPPEPRSLGTNLALGAHNVARCGAGAVSWWMLGNRLVHVPAEGEPQTVGSVAAAFALVCDDQQLIALEKLGDVEESENDAEASEDADAALHLTPCQPAKCGEVIELPFPREARVVSSHGPKHGAAIGALTNGVVAMWTMQGGEAPALLGYARVDLVEEPVGMVEWAGKLWLVDIASNSLRVSELPW